jgi:hypothetical protein
MNKLLSIIVLVLLAFIFFQYDGCTYIDKKSEITIVHDTTWERHDSLIIKKLKIKEVIHDTLPPEYIADTNYPKLKAQYETLVSDFLAKNVYADTVKLDTLGYVAVADTVYKNELLNRSYKYNYKIPTIHTTTTITKYAPLKNQLYVGGGIGGNKTLGVTSLNAGVLLKTKSDQIYNVTLGTSVEGQISYGFQTFWKLKK